MAVSKAVEEGATAVICASTGNTSASAAAYAARAGLTAAVVIPRGKIAAGKARPGPRPRRPGASPDGVRRGAARGARARRRHPIALVNSLNEYRIDGQRTGAFEVCDDLGDAPDVLCIPVGNAGNIAAYWLGFQAYREAERSRRLPRLYGFQAAGAAPLVEGHASPGPRRSPPPSGSATPPGAARRSTRCASRAAASPP